MKKTVNYLCGVLLCAFVCCVATVLPQASSSLAELRGTVTDVNGAAIPNASVTLTDASRGTARTAATTEDGEYIFLGLQPSDYDLKVEAAGTNFAASTTRITLTIGQQANIPVQLGATGVEAQVDIVAGSEVVETGRTQQSNVINEREIIDLPVSRRNFLDLALLTPGVSDSDNINDASDARVAQGRSSGLSFGGNNGRGNLVTVDGGPVITTTGGVFETVSQEAVQEFQVLRNSYSAEFGPSSGGIVNTVSKSGTNRISGSAFGLFRTDKLDARNAFDFNPEGQSPFNRQQFGGSFGAPIKTDKTFFFVAAERFRQKQSTFVDLRLSPSSLQPSTSQIALLNFLQNNPGSPFAALATGLRNNLTTANFTNTVNLFNAASSQFPFDANQTYFSARVDHNFSDTTTGFIRFSANDQLEENQAAGALTAVSRGRTLNQFNSGVLLGLTSQLDSNTINEFKADFFYYKSRLTPNDPNGPEINIRGAGNFGRDIFLPSIGIQRNFDFIDNLTKVTGNHTIKFGGNAFFVNQLDTNETFFGGRFNFEPVIPFAAIVPAQFQGAVQTYLATTNPALLANYTTPISALQSYNLALPAVYQQGFGTTTIRGLNVRAGVYLQDTWKVANNFTLNYGLRYSQNREPFGLHRDKNDFQPRAAFSYDPLSNGKTVIRGGAGIFSAYVNRLVSGVIRTLGNPSFPDDNINIVLATATSGGLPLNPAQFGQIDCRSGAVNTTNPLLNGCAPSSFTVYQTLLAATNGFSRPVTVADLRFRNTPNSPFYNLVPSENGTLEVRFIADPEYKTPESYQASFAVEQDLGAGFSFEAAYLFNRGIFLMRNRDINQVRASLLTRDGNKPCFNRIPGSAIPATCYNPAVGPNAAVQPPLATTDFRNPLRFQDNIYESSASSFYHGATFTLRRRFAQNVSVLAHYTFSKTIDEVTDFNSDFSAQNPLNLREDRALSAFDQRHRVVVSGVFQAPDLGDGAAGAFFKDFVFAPIFTFGSGRPFNLLTGGDTNNDGRSLTDRPFNLGRNTGIGESIITFDARLSRRFQLAERRYLELIFEGFNLFNRTNFNGINNEVGNLIVGANGQTSNGLTTDQVNSLLNGRGRAIRGAASTAPLGFTSAGQARQFQFGARFNF